MKPGTELNITILRGIFSSFSRKSNDILIRSIYKDIIRIPCFARYHLLCETLVNLLTQHTHG